MSALHTSSKKQFTLIELLVVIAIIGILAALILPALTMVKARSLVAKCQSNLRQVGIAMMSYSVSYNGVFPHPDADAGYCWYDLLDDTYLSNADSVVKQCPADMIGNDDGLTALDAQHSFKMNIDAPKTGAAFTAGVWSGDLLFPEYLADVPAGARGRYFPRQSLIKNPGVCVLVFDGKSNLNDPSGGPGVSYWERHDGIINLLMCDGSVVQYLPPDAHKEADGTCSTDDPTLHYSQFTFRSKR